MFRSLDMLIARICLVSDSIDIQSHMISEPPSVEFHLLEYKKIQISWSCYEIIFSGLYFCIQSPIAL
jgi:hypothetical protein